MTISIFAGASRSRRAPRPVAEGGIAFGTGHLSAEEVWAAVRAAHERGVERICITHALMSRPGGARGLPRAVPRDRRRGRVHDVPGAGLGDALAETLREIGIEHVTLSTDAGLKGTSGGVESYLWLLAKLLEAGFAEAEIDVMSKDVPGRLLGIRAQVRT